MADGPMGVTLDSLDEQIRRVLTGLREIAATSQRIERLLQQGPYQEIAQLRQEHIAATQRLRVLEQQLHSQNRDPPCLP